MVQSFARADSAPVVSPCAESTTLQRVALKLRALKGSSFTRGHRDGMLESARTSMSLKCQPRALPSGNATVFRHHTPFVFHYRGEGNFKPWILRPSSSRADWTDPCGAFLDAFDAFERQYAAAVAASLAR